MAIPTSLPSAAAPARRRTFPSLVGEGIRDLLGRERLIRYMVGADLKRTHADTVLGQVWWVLDPLLQMVIYFVLVTIVFQRSIPDYPLFIFSAVLPWKWFTTALNASSVSVTGREGLLRQIPFPKLVLPVAAISAGTMSFCFGLIALALMYLPYLHRLSPWVLTIPLIAGVQLTFMLALGIALSAVNAFYRDVQNVLGHILRLWFYLSPGLYSLDHLTHHSLIRQILSLNPMAPVLESYHNVIWGTDTTGGVAPEFLGLAWVLVLSLALVAIAIAVFKRVEPAFARII